MMGCNSHVHHSSYSYSKKPVVSFYSILACWWLMSPLATVVYYRGLLIPDTSHIDIASYSYSTITTTITPSPIIITSLCHYYTLHTTRTRHQTTPARRPPPSHHRHRPRPPTAHLPSATSSSQSRGRTSQHHNEQPCSGVRIMHHCTIHHHCFSNNMRAAANNRVHAF
jgi:hypothetical protein